MTRDRQVTARLPPSAHRIVSARGQRCLKSKETEMMRINLARPFIAGQKMHYSAEAVHSEFVPSLVLISFILIGLMLIALKIAKP